MRSLATRRQQPRDERGARATRSRCCARGGFDLVVVETAGIGQSDSEIVDLVDVPMYVMTTEYGAASQLEKIDMLDFADLVVLNKFESAAPRTRCATCASSGGATTSAFARADDEVPVFPTIASRFNDPGVDAAVRRARARCSSATTGLADAGTSRRRRRAATRSRATLDPRRARPLPGARSPSGRRARLERRAIERAGARRRTRRSSSRRALRGARAPRCAPADARASCDDCARYDDARGASRSQLLAAWAAARRRGRPTPQYSYTVRGREIRGENYRETLSARASRRSRAPRLASWGELLRFLLKENLPGRVPVHGGRLPVPARGRGPDAHVRGRGDARAHQPALPLPRRRPGGRAALDRVRLGHALRRGSRPSGPTSTARSATPACRSRRSTT